MNVHTVFFLSLLLLLFPSSFSTASPHRNFTVNNGLTVNEVTCITQDPDFKSIWIGTQNGLNRYNGIGVQRIFQEEPSASNFITALSPDSKGCLWVATSKGLRAYDYYSNHWLGDVHLFPDKSINQLCSLNRSTLVGILDNSSLFVVNTANNCSSLIQTFPPSVRLSHLEVVNGTTYITSNKGVYVFDVEKNSIQRVEALSGGVCSHITFLTETRELWLHRGAEWLCVPIENETVLWKHYKIYGFHDYPSSVGGIDYFQGQYVLSLYNGIVKIGQNALSSSFDEIQYSLEDYGFHTMIKDHCGSLWLGSWQTGAVMVPEQMTPFITYSPSRSGRQYSPSRLIRSFEYLDERTLIVATETDGILLLDKENQTFSPPIVGEQEIKNHSFSVNGPILHVIKQDYKGRIWGGYHQNGFNVIVGPGKEALNSKITKLPRAIKYSICDDIMVDSLQQKVFLLTRNSILCFDEKSKSFTTVLSNQKNLSNFSRDNDGNFWVAGRQGVRVFHSDFRSINKTVMKSLKHHDLYDMDVNCVLQDSDNKLWLGTYGKGLYYYDQALNTFHSVSSSNADEFRIVYSMHFDKQDRLWIGTDNSLFVMNSEGKFCRFSSNDGVQDNQFNYNSVFEASDGELFFGGVQGFTRFHPDSIKLKKEIAIPLLTGLSIGGHKQNIYSKKQLVSEVEIPFSNNQFEFEFHAPISNTVNHCRYRYRLNGYIKEWVNCDLDKPKAIFQNIPSGTYDLEIEVRLSNAVNFVRAHGPAIVVLPPWYLSYYAFVSYFCTIFLLICASIYLTKRKSEFVHSIKMAEIEKSRTEELSRAKLQFFTEIAHEIRTPLTLIVGPLSDLLKQRRFEKPVTALLSMVHQNTARLVELVDELLLFRKAEHGDLPLKLQEDDLGVMVLEALTLFENQIKDAEVNITFTDLSNEKQLVFDKSKLSKVITNVLSNAIKFTPNGGTIVITAKTDANGFSFSIVDNGCGMKQENVALVFDRFYRVPKTNTAGFGIGLALCKKIVDAHYGRIMVESEEGEGTKVEVFIPYLEPNVEDHSQIELPNIAVSSTIENSLSLKEKETTLLIVEDNKEVMQYLEMIFQDDYFLLFAGNGLEGERLALEKLPDIIVTDYQMPIQDGVSLCKKLKAELLTSHIPVILLSAFNEKDDQINGLSVGADDYIGKPFDSDVLKMKVRNLVESRKKLKQQYRSQKELDMENISNTDQRFLNRLNRIVAQELSNENFDVTMLCEQLEMGKTKLSAKLKSLLEISPAEYIKKARMKEGYRLLTKEEFSISEAAFAVGFNPSYFAACFKKEFGVSPKMVRL